MTLSDQSIRRPVLAWVFTLVIVIIGIVGYARLPVRELPDVDFPVVNVSVTWRGASPDVIETEVVDALEEELSTLEGVKLIQSQSSEQRAQITIEFELEQNIDVAVQDVRDAVARARRRLPQDIDEPIVLKVDPGANAVMWIGVNSDWMSRVQLSDFADRVLKERLQSIAGVGQVLIGGQQRFAVRIDLDAAQLAARRLTVSDVVNALRRENIELPTGLIESRMREFVVRTQGRFPTAESFNELVIAQVDGAPVRIQDVGEARYGVENERMLARFMGKPSVGLGVFKQSKANTLEVANRVKAELDRIRRELLPPGVAMEVAFDSSQFIEESVKATVDALWQAALLVVLVIFLFLRSVRTSFIPAVVIPVAVMGTFAVMYALGFSINIFTLLGLILAIGLLVDDAIVMLENIYRHAEKEGKPPMQAAQAGAREITFAVIVTSISLAAVFVPVAFIPGVVGRLFYEFGLTVVAAVFISTFVALTLTPMLCSRLLKVKRRHNRVYDALEVAFNAMSAGYMRLLGAALRHRFVTVLGGVAAFALGVWLLGAVKKEQVPRQDQSGFMMQGRAPEGATLEQSDRVLRQVEEILASTPEVRSYLVNLGMGMGAPSSPNRATAFVSLRNAAERRRDQFAVMDELRGKLAQIPGMRLFLMDRPLVRGSGQSAPIQFVIQHPDLDRLAQLSNAMEQRLRQTPGFSDVRSDLEINKPEFELRIDRAKAADLGISAQQIAETLQVLLGGQNVSSFKDRGKQYDVIVQMRREDRQRPRDLEAIYLRSRGGELVPLTNLVSYTETVAASQLNHYNRRRAAVIYANLAGLTQQEGMKLVEAMAAELLGQEASHEWAGSARDFGQSMRALAATFLLATALIYLALAAQFESWVHPFTIMLGLPLALVGALGGLWLFGQTLNIYSAIGMIMLVGLVSKNGILLVDYINQQRARGVELRQAAVAAGGVRLRPILMTALTTMIGVLPIALGLGAGGEARSPLGVVIIGGMFTSTALTLVVVPVAYTLLDDAKSRLKALFSGRTRG
jgi:multidrug efflux pump